MFQRQKVDDKEAGVTVTCNLWLHARMPVSRDNSLKYRKENWKVKVDKREKPKIIAKDWYTSDKSARQKIQ
jgi:hypothetical protein